MIHKNFSEKLKRDPHELGVTKDTENDSLDPSSEAPKRGRPKKGERKALSLYIPLDIFTKVQVACSAEGGLQPYLLRLIQEDLVKNEDFYRSLAQHRGLDY